MDEVRVMNGQTETVSATDLYSPDLLGRATEFWNAFDVRYQKQALSVPEVTQLFLNCNLFKKNPDGRISPNLDWMFFC